MPKLAAAIITGHDGEAVEAVGQVDRVAGADNDEGAEHHEEPAEIQHHVLEERNRQRGRERHRVRAGSARSSAASAITALDRKPDAWPAKPPWLCLVTFR